MKSRIGTYTDVGIVGHEVDKLVLVRVPIGSHFVGLNEGCWSQMLQETIL